MNVKLSVDNLPYFLLHPNSSKLSKTDRKIIWTIGIIVGVFTLGLSHLVCKIIYMVDKSKSEHSSTVSKTDRATNAILNGVVKTTNIETPLPETPNTPQDNQEDVLDPQNFKSSGTENFEGTSKDSEQIQNNSSTTVSIFNFLTNNTYGVQEKIFDIPDYEGGEFKSNMQALLSFVSELSKKMNDTEKVDSRNAFDYFQEQINEEKNLSAKQAFIAYGEILNATKISNENLQDKLDKYGEVEAKVQRGREKLKKVFSEFKSASTEDVLLKSARAINEALSGLPKLEKSPYLKNLLIQNVGSIDSTFAIFKERVRKTLPSDIQQEVDKAIQNMKKHLNASKKDKIDCVIDLGSRILENPESFSNKYLDIRDGISFSESVPVISQEILDFLNKVNISLDKISTGQEFVAMEAFILTLLCAYSIDAQASLEPNRALIVDTLLAIKEKINEKLSSNLLSLEAPELRKNEKNQKFYKLIKKKIEETPNYSIDFWFDPHASEKMKIPEPLLLLIGRKISEPESPLGDLVQLIPKNKDLGLEIYFYPSTSRQEKSKLLLFPTRDPFSSISQEMNHQLGLFGDKAILAYAQEMMSYIISTEVLAGYLQDLEKGDVEIIASGFHNSGAAATIVANRMAMLYPKSQVRSIAAGSTATVTTEDAYNMNQVENFFPIRLKSPADKAVDRQLQDFRVEDFSDDSYRTFPLLVRYNQSLIDINKHNRQEYGNIDNFIPAMTHPLKLRNLYDEISHYIIYNKPEREMTEADEKYVSSSMFDSISAIEPQFRFQMGAIDELIKLGTEMRLNISDYNDTFLKIDEQKLSTSNRTEQLKQLEMAQQEAIEKDKKEMKTANSGWSDYISGFNPLTLFKPVQQPKAIELQKKFLSQEEQECTIRILQQTIFFLKDPEVINVISIDQAFSLLIAVDVLLINYTKINASVGKMPQVIDVISQMRHLIIKRIEISSDDANEDFRSLITKEISNFKFLKQRVNGLNQFYQNLFEGVDVLSKIDFEDKFLEFLGFKIAVKGQEKIGSELYTAPLCADNTNHYDITLFTPEDLNKKQRVVICCNNSAMQPGVHGLVSKGEFGTGDKAILERAEDLKELISKQLEEQFETLNLTPGDIDIVVMGFGCEGAVATALGYSLAKKYENSQVQSLGFGAPRFTVAESVYKIKNQANFVPIRFLSPIDTAVEWKLNNIADYGLSHGTFHTVPFQVRIAGAFEFGGHNTNLYGDIQGIKTTMKTAYQMRAIAKEEKHLESLAKSSEKISSVSIEIPKRVVIDTQQTQLVDYGSKTVEELSKVDPGKLIRIMNYCVKLSENPSISESNTKLIKNYFGVFIKAIRNEEISEEYAIQNSFHQKMVNHGYKPHQLFGGKWKLQQMLSEDLTKAMADVTNADPNMDPKAKSELILRRSYYRGILAGDLNGNRYKPAGAGVNGAVFFRHLESDSNKDTDLLPEEKQHILFLGVFKPHPKTVRESKSLLNPGQLQERLKAIAGMDANLNKKTDPNCRVHNEIFAYEIFHIFGFNAYVGFPTTLKFTNKNDSVGRPASFCAFMSGWDDVASHVTKATKKPKSNFLNTSGKKYSDKERHIWEMSKLLDFLTGNMDGHEGNAFVKIMDNQLVGAVNFDYDKAFAIRKTPGIGNQYKWTQLAISKHEFTQATRSALRQMLETAEDRVLVFLAKAREESKDKQNFTEVQENLLRERIEILKKVANGTIQNLSDLDKYK